MIDIDADLPLGALVDGPALMLETMISDAYGFWLHGDGVGFDRDAEGAVTRWHPRAGTLPATQTRPNDGNASHHETRHYGGLATRTGVNCGMVLPDVAHGADCFSIAIIFCPDAQADARTLVTLNPRSNDKQQQSGWYFFVSQEDGMLTVKDTTENLSLSVPTDTDAITPQLVIVTVSSGNLAVQKNFGPVHEVIGTKPDIAGTADLFIAARSHRRGLIKTLGQALICDVFFWPDNRLLIPATAEDNTTHAALLRYFRWVY